MRAADIGSTRVRERTLRRLVAIAVTPVTALGVGMTSVSASGNELTQPAVIELFDQCLYTAAPAVEYNVSRLRLVLAPGFAYDVAINGTPVQPNDGGTFDTSGLSGAGEFYKDVDAAAPGQTDAVTVSQAGVSLMEREITTGACYQNATDTSIARSAGQIKRGETVTISGRLHTTEGAPVPGEIVALQRRFVGGATWSTLSSAMSGSTGSVNFTAKPSADTEYRLRHTATDRYGSSTSPVTTVRVQQPTTLSISRSPSTVTAGQTVTVSGRLRTSDGVDVRNRPVTFQRRFAGATSWTTVGTTYTSNTGRVSFTAKPSRHTEYRLRHASNTAFGASTSAVTKASVRPALTLTTTRLNGLLGRTTTFKGTVSPYYSKQTVQLQRLVSGSWRTVATTKPSTSGAYSFSVKPTSTGSRTYRVRVPATDRHASVTSGSKKIVRYMARITTIVYDAPGNDWDNLNGEYVVVKNTGSISINLNGWELDATPQRRTLPSYTLSPGNTVRIHTGSGSQRSGHIYLGYKSPIWNNNGDTGRLYDPYGNLASTFKY